MEKSTFDLLTQERAESVETQAQTSIDDPAVLSLELFMKAKSQSQEWRDQMVEDWDFFLGAQTSLEKNLENKKRKQKTYNVDVIYQAVEQAIALLTSNKPRFSCTGAEDSDTRIAQVYAAIMQSIWNKNKATSKLKQSIKDYYVGSIGWFHLYWNPYADNGKGEVAIDSVDPKRVYVSDARDFFFDDAAHIMLETFLTSEMMQKQHNMTLEEVEKFRPVTGEQYYVSTRESEYASGSSHYKMTQTPMFQRIDRYSKIKELVFVLEKDDERFEMLVDPRQFEERTKNTICIVSTSQTATSYFVHPRNVANVMKLYRAYGEMFHEVTSEANPEQTMLMSGVEGQVEYQPGMTPVPNSTTMLKIITLFDAVSEGKVQLRKALVDRIKHVASIGTQVLFENTLPTGFHVLVPLINNFDRTTFPIGDVRRVKREQEFINSLRQLVVTHAAVSTNFKIGYPEGRYTEAKLSEIYNDPQKRFIPYDAELTSSGLQILAPPPLPNHLYTLEQQARRNIEERLGIFALMQGSPTDAPNTYKGTVALDEYGQRRIKSKKDDIEEFLNRIGAIVIDFVQFYYTESRIINLVSPNDKPMSISLRNDSVVDDLYIGNEYRINDLMVGRFDLVVVSGSTLPSNRFALLEMYADLYKMGLVDQETVLQKTEVANVEQVMERIGMIRNLQAQLQQAQEEIKKLSGDMQTKDRELMHAKQDRDMTIFKKNLETEEMKATAARMVYEQTLKLQKRSSIL